MPAELHAIRGYSFESFAPLCGHTSAFSSFFLRKSQSETLVSIRDSPNDAHGFTYCRLRVLHSTISAAMSSVCISNPESGGERPTPFRAVLLHEKMTGAGANRVKNFALALLEPAFVSKTTQWDLSKVEIGSLSTLIDLQDAPAEVVVISLRDGAGLSSSLRIWISKWILRRRGMHSAMVVLFDSPGQETDFARRHLRNAAQRAGIDFFTQTGTASEEEAHFDELLLAV